VQKLPKLLKRSSFLVADTPLSFQLARKA